MAGRRCAAAALLALLVSGGAALAQDLPSLPRQGFLYLNEERILTGSVRGQALLAEETAARNDLRNEARRIDAAFEEEEKDLTEQRRQLDPVAFRKLADDFDSRVVEARRQQDERANALAAEFDQKRRQFYADVGPVLVGLMERRGAAAIFDETSILLADQSLNITEEVIAELDRAAPQTPPSTGDVTPIAPPQDAAPAEGTEEGEGGQ
jgi:Skp family chaperone for outer membrane proteins